MVGVVVGGVGGSLDEAGHAAARILAAPPAFQAPPHLVQQVGHAVAGLREIQLAVREVVRGRLIGPHHIEHRHVVGLVAVPVRRIVPPTDDVGGEAGAVQGAAHRIEDGKVLGPAGLLRERHVASLVDGVMHFGLGSRPCGVGRFQGAGGALVIEQARGGVEGLPVGVLGMAEGPGAAHPGHGDEEIAFGLQPGEVHLVHILAIHEGARFRLVVLVLGGKAGVAFAQGHRAGEDFLAGLHIHHLKGLGVVEGHRAQLIAGRAQVGHLQRGVAPVARLVHLDGPRHQAQFVVGEGDGAPVAHRDGVAGVGLKGLR